jgi:hypothetical protein
MAYEHERDEWRSAVRASSPAELDAAKDAHRRALGIVGDPSDVEIDDTPTKEEDEER